MILNRIYRYLRAIATIALFFFAIGCSPARKSVREIKKELDSTRIEVDLSAANDPDRDNYYRLRKNSKSLEQCIPLDSEKVIVSIKVEVQVTGVPYSLRVEKSTLGEDATNCIVDRISMIRFRTYNREQTFWVKIHSLGLSSNGALELNAHSFMKRTIAENIGVGDGHWGNVSLIGRSRVSALYQRRVGDA